MQVPAVREAVMETARCFELLAPPAPQHPRHSHLHRPDSVVKAPRRWSSPRPRAPALPLSKWRRRQKGLRRPRHPSGQPVVVEAPPRRLRPKLIPASALQYLDAAPPEYPRTSRRLNETGTVTLRVYIDERGLPSTVQVSRGSGFARLDESALAAVKKWRFKPYSENGAPMAGWAVIPVIFELEK